MKIKFSPAAAESGRWRQLAAVDSPTLDAVRRVDQGIEQFRLTLQSAASEGDIDKLKDVQAVVDKTHQVLATPGGVGEKAELSRNAAQPPSSRAA